MWLLSLTYAPFKGKWFTARPSRSIQFQRQAGTFSCHRTVVYFLSLQCYINQQTQHNRPNIPFLHSALQNVSAVRISHRHAAIGSHKEKKLEVSPNKQGCKLFIVTTVIPYKKSNYMKECVRNFPVQYNVSDQTQSWN